jgi:AraC family L-rhamnose operon transcriptional activator RhaR
VNTEEGRFRKMPVGKIFLNKGESFFKDNIPIYLNVATEQKREKCSFHKHDFIEIAYVNSGRGLHLVGDKEYPVSKGDISIINYGIPHVFIQNNEDNEGDFIVYNCVFKPEFIDYSLINSNDFKAITTSLLFNAFFIEDKPAINLKLTGINQSEIEEIYKNMQLEYFTKPKGHVNILRSYLIQLLTKIFRILEASSSEQNINLHKSEIIKKALEFLNKNYSSQNINMEEVAMKTFLSRSYLSRLFKETTGRNFSEYLQNLRISEACILLKTTDKKITDIISDVGFKDTKHFYQLFKKITGKTPREYRKT